MSQILQRGRESLGWSRERMAANVMIGESELQHLEESEEYTGLDTGNRAVRDILNVFKIRKVTIMDDGSAVGPNDDESIAALRLSNNDVIVLGQIAVYGDRGMPFGRVDDIPKEAVDGLRRNLLVQLSTVRRITHLSFDGEDISYEERPPEFHVRLSLRGKAALAYHIKRADHEMFGNLEIAPHGD